jgi:hypothetical protein
MMQNLLYFRTRLIANKLSSFFICDAIAAQMFCDAAHMRRHELIISCHGALCYKRIDRSLRAVMIHLDHPSLVNPQHEDKRPQGEKLFARSNLPTPAGHPGGHYPAPVTNDPATLDLGHEEGV